MSAFIFWRKSFTGANFEANKQKISILEDIANQKNCTPAQLSIAWVLHQGNDIVPLIGTTNRKRLAENLQALDIHLSESDLKFLNETFHEDAIAGTRYDERQMGMVAN